jgi:hypothetical protein
MNLSFTGTTAELVAASDTDNLVPWQVTTVDHAEVLDQQQTNFGGGGMTVENNPMAQVFTPTQTGYLTHFAFAAYPCYAAWNEPCGYKLELRTVDASGNPAQVLWTGRGQEPPQPDPNWAFGWATTTLDGPPLVHAGTQYALVLTPDWWEEFIFGTGNPGYAVVWEPDYGYWARIGNGDDLLFKTWVTELDTL